MIIAVYIIEGFLALAFLGSGFAKIVGAEAMKKNFISYGYPQWFRVVTGFVEAVSALLLIAGYFVPVLAPIGAAILIITMIGAVITHIRIKSKSGETMPSIILLILSVILFILTYHTLIK